MAAPQIVPYDPAWPSSASATLARIAQALSGRSDRSLLRYEHIGSTAVPGLAAKPFIDLQVLFPAIPAESELLAPLGEIGFVRARGARPDSPGVDRDISRPGTPDAHHEKLLYVADGADGAPATILHLRRLDSPFADFVRAFRDWLRTDPAARAEYEGLKRGLASAHADAEDYDDYTRAKGDFMDRAQRAMCWPRASAAADGPRPILEG